MNEIVKTGTAIDPSARDQLLKIAQNHGTPCYAFDVRRMRTQVERLRNLLPETVEVFYSLKANASLGICDVFADCGLGADVASAGEFATAIEAGFPQDRIFVAGPFKSNESLALLRSSPKSIVSVDSLSELRMLGDSDLSNPMVLRLRPDFGSCAVVPAGCESRFGLTEEDLARCRDDLPESGLNIIGFHIFAGSQVLAADEVISHLSREVDLALRAADVLNITPTFINLGGGFGTPYASDDVDLDLAAVGQAMEKFNQRVGESRLALELGRFLVAQAGWYLTTVIGQQTVNGRPAVVVDGGVHQRADMCGLNLRTKANPPIALDADDSSLVATDVLGCLSLPDDVMAESSHLPQLSTGNILAFANAGAYGVWSSPAMFHGLPLPVEVAFDEQSSYLMRDRQPAHAILENQYHVIQKSDHPKSITDKSPAAGGLQATPVSNE